MTTRLQLCAALCSWMAASASGQTIHTVANFTNPSTAIIQGSDGNFYGTSGLGGSGVCLGVVVLDGCGTVFKVTPAGAVSTVYGFQTDPVTNDSFPVPNALIQGTDGNFYGTTSDGGSGCGLGCGTIFKVTPAGSYTLLHTFEETDGSAPAGSLVQGSDGNFYGVTSSGGAVICQELIPCGTVFKITPQGSFTLLYSFDVTHGATPTSLIQGADGNFYGTASAGGAGHFCPGLDSLAFNGCGTIFEITPTGTLTTLYTFHGAADGSMPTNLIQTKDGNFYGLASSNNGLGSIFQLTPAGVLNTLVTFDGSNGAAPNSLIQASDGNLYGTTSGVSGVLDNGAVAVQSIPGTLFQMTLSGTLTTLYNFCTFAGCPEPSTAGGFSLLQGSDGNFYGTTNTGGTNKAGVLFEYPLISPIVPAIASSNGIVNGASFQPGISPGSWITINGSNLAASPATWNSAIVNGALPTELGGVTVSVGGLPVYVEYVSAGQINAIAPDVPAGPAQVIVTNSNGSSQAVNTQVAAETPAFFQWGSYAVATHQDYSPAVKNGTFAGTTTVPAKPGDVIILWGTGFGATSPAVPSGMETPSNNTTYNTASTVSVTIGTTTTMVYGAALAPAYAGLYQIAIQIPAGLANGDYPVVATIDGASSPSTTLITVQQ